MAIQKKLKQKTRQFIESKNMLGGITIASFLESTIVPIPLEKRCTNESFAKEKSDIEITMKGNMA